MTNDRPYRAAIPSEEALAEIERNSGTQFDPRVVGAFKIAYLDWESAERRRAEREETHGH